MNCEAYSTAPRCSPCGERALLSARGAERLASASKGQLVTFECPDKMGWHVWAPDLERMSTRQA